MEANFIKLSNFLTEKEYLNLKRYFLSADINELIIDEKKLRDDNPTIYVADFKYVSEEYPFVQFDVKKEFIKDFVIPGLDSVCLNFLIDFKREIIERNLFSKENREGFALQKTNELVIIEEKIASETYMNNEIIELLLEQIKKIKKNLKEYLLNPFPNVKNKIKFNWNKTDVVVLFYLLKQNGYILNGNMADIAAVLDGYFQYTNDEGVLCSVNDSRLDLNNYKSGKAITESLDRLREKLSEDDFYNH